MSPDRVDALVWAFTDLLVEPMESAGYFEWARQTAARLKPQPAPPPAKIYASGSQEYEAAPRDPLERFRRPYADE